MARRVKLPNATSGEFMPLGKRPRGIDLTELAKLEAEEREIREARKQERANSKVLKIRVKPGVYRDLLALSQEFDREINAQATECFEMGVRFYKNAETPHGGVRPLNMLPELRHGTMMAEQPAEVHFSSEPRTQGQRRYGTDADPEAATGWLPGAGLPVAREKPFRQVAMEEPDPTFEQPGTGEVPPPEHEPDEVVDEEYVEGDTFKVEV